MTPAPSFLSAIKPVTHEVNGETVEFYPLSVGELFQIKDLLKPVARSLSVLLSDTGGDRGSFSHSEFDPLDPRPATAQTAKVFERSETPVSVEVARFRSEERAKAASDLVEAFTNRTNGKAVARIILDSLRIERPVTDKSAEELFNSLDIVTLKALLVGVGKANANVLGPFQGRVEGILRTTTPANGTAEPMAMVG